MNDFLGLMRSSHLWLMVLLGSAAICGCTRYVKPPPPVDQGAYLVHVVASSGETVRYLTKWYTGSEKATKDIAAVNSVRDGYYLKQGQRILIPYSYVRKTAPPPKQQATKRGSHKSKDRRGPAESETAQESATSESLDSPVSSSNGSLDQTTTSVGELNPPSPNGAPQVSDTATATVGESNLDELLKQEQREVEILKKELEGSAPAGQ